MTEANNTVSRPAFLRRLVSEPLVHFFAIALLLFALYDGLNEDARVDGAAIVVDAERLGALREAFLRTWQRPPSEEEMRGLVDNWIREEILYREGLAMRLDLDDPVVRRRIAQKMGFISELLVPAAPEDPVLEAWLGRHPDAYRLPARYTLRQVYFDPSRHGQALPAAIEAAHTALAAGGEAGDATLLPPLLENASAQEIARTFGEAFAEAVTDAPVGGWSGPVQSGFGQHLVYVESVDPARLPALHEVRDAVARDYVRAQAEEADAAFYESLRQKYTITIADPGIAPGPVR